MQFGIVENMARRANWAGWPVVIHCVRTAVAAVASLLVARAFRLPASYWAPITTLVITQSSLGAALAVSRQRFLGTALGAAVGVAASHFGPHVFVFGAFVFLLGLICAAVHADNSAYRFGGIALAIVMLVPGSAPAWRIAVDRSAEVSVGIGVALLLSVLWPEKEGAK